MEKERLADQLEKTQEQLARERQETERLERENLEIARQETERLERENAERIRQEEAAAAKDKAAQEAAAQEHAAKEEAAKEAERIAAATELPVRTSSAESLGKSETGGKAFSAYIGDDD